MGQFKFPTPDLPRKVLDNFKYKILMLRKEPILNIAVSTLPGWNVGPAYGKCGKKLHWNEWGAEKKKKTIPSPKAE